MRWMVNVAGLIDEANERCDKQIIENMFLIVFIYTRW